MAKVADDNVDIEIKKGIMAIASKLTGGLGTGESTDNYCAGILKLTEALKNYQSYKQGRTDG